MSVLRCARCRQALGSQAVFQFSGPGSLIYKCFVCALRHGPLLRRSTLIALPVGTILTAINQGDLLLHGQWSAALLWKIPLTYLVPFLVATSGALSSSKRPQ